MGFGGSLGSNDSWFCFSPAVLSDYDSADPEENGSHSEVNPSDPIGRFWRALAPGLILIRFSFQGGEEEEEGFSEEEAPAAAGEPKPAAAAAPTQDEGDEEEGKGEEEAGGVREEESKAEEKGNLAGERQSGDGQVGPDRTTRTFF